MKSKSRVMADPKACSSAKTAGDSIHQGRKSLAKKKPIMLKLGEAGLHLPAVGKDGHCSCWT